MVTDEEERDPARALGSSSQGELSVRKGHLPSILKKGGAKRKSGESLH